MAQYTVHLSSAAQEYKELRVRWNQSTKSFPIKGKTVDIKVPDGVDFVLQCEPIVRTHPVRQVFHRGGVPRQLPPGVESHFRIASEEDELEETEEETNELRDTLGLPATLVKTLAGHNITTIEQLQAQADKGPLKELKGIAESSEKLIREKLAE